jgi:hypothetical protein
MNKILVLTLLVAFTSTLSFARTKIDETKVQESQKIRKKSYNFTKQIDDLKTVGKFKRIAKKKIIIPYFRVTFATGGEYLNSVGGVTTAKTKVYSSLSSIEAQTMQEITNTIYTDLLTHLSEAGYEVEDISILEENDQYQKLQEKNKYPIIKKKHSQFTPNNSYYPGKSSVKAYMLASEIDALFLRADYTVNFVVLNRNKQKFSILKGKDQVKATQGINVFGELSITTKKGAVSFISQQPISSDKSFGELVKATTKMNKVSDSDALLASLRNGRAGDRQSTTTVEVNADPQLYKEAVNDDLNKASTTLV